MTLATARFLDGNLKNEITTGAHVFTSDVGVAEGGEDAGPSPHDLLASSLAACTGLTLRMYAQRKNWPLANAIVKVEISKSTEKTLFTRTLSFIGDLDQLQKDRLLDIANHCPIHKVLSAKIDIETKLL